MAKPPFPETALDANPISFTCWVNKTTQGQKKNQKKKKPWVKVKFILYLYSETFLPFQSGL